jgi:hypothetical protein
VLAAAVILVATSARAQTTAVSMDLDPSVVSAGMGGASTAVPWGGDPNVWANPALLGYAQGVRWQWGRTRLLPGLADDLVFTHTRLLIGGSGIGVENAGDPLEAGGIELDYGSDPILSGHETVNATGFGVSASRLVAAIAAWRDEDPPALFERADLAFGWRRKETTLFFDGFGSGDAAATSSDLGLLVRVGSANPVDPPARSWELTYAYAVLNSDDSRFRFFPTDIGVPPSRHHRHGVAGRITMQREGDARDGWIGAILRGFEPWLTATLAYDRVHVIPAADDFEGFGGAGYNQDLVGVEVAFANVLSVRGGRVGDRQGGFHHGSWGLGLNLPVADVAGFRFDYAKYPQSSDLDFLDRRAYAVWIDPFAAWSAFRD